MGDTNGKIGALPPHVATLQRHERPGALPPHPAKVMQRRVAPFAVSQAQTPHPAQGVRTRESPPHAAHPAWPLGALVQRSAGPGGEERRGGIAQRARVMPAAPAAYTGVAPIAELQDISEAFRAFAKAKDTTTQEVQAMWYKHATGGALQLAVSANNTAGGKGAVNAIDEGLKMALLEKKKYPGGAIGTAKGYLNSSAHLTYASAKLVGGCSHAEQNLLKWIAPNLTAESVFYIAGTKDPCTQCKPRMSGYQALLVTAGHANMFTYHDGGANQAVLESDVKEQVDYQALAVP
jgi:hypothetical protein